MRKEGYSFKAVSIIYFKQKLIDTISSDIQKVENDIQKILMIINKNKLSEIKETNITTDYRQFGSSYQSNPVKSNKILYNVNEQNNLLKFGSPLDWSNNNQDIHTINNNRNIG